MAMLKVWDAVNSKWVFVQAPMPEGFGTIQLGEVFIDAEKSNDVLKFINGDHVKILPNETFDAVVITVHDIGDLANLPTINKADIVSAITEINNKINDHGYNHTQIVPATVWTITHNLNRYPSVSITDSGGNIVVGEVQYIDKNKIEISFSAGFSGTAYLN